MSFCICLTAIKNHVIKYCTTVYERNGKHLFWSIKNSGEILNKLKFKGFLHMISLLSILRCTMIEQTFNREGSIYLACYENHVFVFTSEQPKQYKLWSCQKMCNALHYNIFIRLARNYIDKL